MRPQRPQRPDRPSEHRRRPNPRVNRGPRPPVAPRGDYLPTTRADMTARGWDELDVLLITGDAYVDHPAFGVPLLGRLLESRGWRVGIVAQPDWRKSDDITRMGRPKLFCGISAGALDSMLAHYTSFRKKRRDDGGTPGGKDGQRPNRATIVYAGLVKQAFPGLPVVLGGIEASLRRAAHYDFWTDKLRRSILFDSRADVVLYGMAERGVIELAGRIAEGTSLVGLPGSASIVSAAVPEELTGVFAEADMYPPQNIELLPGFDLMENDPTWLVKATRMIERQVHHADHALLQPHGKRSVLLMPPGPPLTSEEFDALYELPFTGLQHPDYTETIPAWDLIHDSLTAVRGCGGGCAFCALSSHQGRRVRSRSAESLQAEAKRVAKRPGFTGTISDVGGPTANAWGSSCEAGPAKCERPSCYAPTVCPHLHLGQGAYLDLLRKLKRTPGVRQVRVASGVRHDLALCDEKFVRGLTGEFVGGHLKVAPEHTVNEVLKRMRKTSFEHFEHFQDLFARINKETGRKQFLVPYIMSALPGCTMDDMKELAEWFRKQGWKLEQVQCFVPTPGCMAAAMYYGECDEDGKPIHVARSDREREDQHAILVPSRQGPPRTR